MVKYYGKQSGRRSSCNLLLNWTVIFAHGTRKFSRTNTSYSLSPSFESIKNLATIIPELWIRVALRVIQNAVFVVSGSMEMTSYTHIAETSTSDVTYAIVKMAAENNNTLSTTIHWKSISGRITSFARIGSAWRRSLLYSTQRWT